MDEKHERIDSLEAQVHTLQAHVSALESLVAALLLASPQVAQMLVDGQEHFIAGDLASDSPDDLLERSRQLILLMATQVLPGGD